MGIKMTIRIPVHEIEHKCPHCSKLFSERYFISPKGGVLGSPIIKCKSCGKEFYDPRLIEFYDLPEETAKSIEAAIPRREKIWSTLCQVDVWLFFVMLIIYFKFFNKLFDSSTSPAITLTATGLLSFSAIFLFVCYAQSIEMANYFSGEKRRSKRRMAKAEYVSKLNKYKDEYKRLSSMAYRAE